MNQKRKRVVENVDITSCTSADVDSNTGNIHIKQERLDEVATLHSTEDGELSQSFVS